jgi:solute carrier family 6 GABA transporter-like protein 1
MGQHLQTGDVGVSGHFSKHLRGVGVASVLSGMMVAMYYVPLISWCIRAFVESFGSMKDDWKDMSGSQATNYFFHNLIGTYTLDESRRPTRIVPLNVLYLAITWIIVGACLAFGIKWTGRVAYFTMGLPVVMMLILLIRALTLPGASNGIHAYIGDWDMKVLFESPDIWSTAVSQIFFSMGVAVSLQFICEQGLLGGD